MTIKYTKYEKKEHTKYNLNITDYVFQADSIEWFVDFWNILIERYGCVSVANVKILFGTKPKNIDYKMGWAHYISIDKNVKVYTRHNRIYSKLKNIDDPKEFT